MIYRADNGRVPRAVDPHARQVIARNLRAAWQRSGVGNVGIAAEHLGMSQAQFSGYLRGHRGFSIETLLRLAVGLRCALDDLVVGVNETYSMRSASRRYDTRDPIVLGVVEALQAIENEPYRLRTLETLRDVAGLPPLSLPSFESIRETRVGANTKSARPKRR